MWRKGLDFFVLTLFSTETFYAQQLHEQLSEAPKKFFQHWPHGLLLQEKSVDFKSKLTQIKIFSRLKLKFDKENLHYHEPRSV